MENIEQWVALIGILWGIIQQVRAWYANARVGRVEKANEDLSKVLDGSVAAIEKVSRIFPNDPAVKAIKATTLGVNTRLGTELPVLAPRVVAISEQVASILAYESPAAVDARIATMIANRSALAKK